MPLIAEVGSNLSETAGVGAAGLIPMGLHETGDDPELSPSGFNSGLSLLGRTVPLCAGGQVERRR